MGARMKALAAAWNSGALSAEGNALLAALLDASGDPAWTAVLDQALLQCRSDAQRAEIRNIKESASPRRNTSSPRPGP
jgi:hypothetical protein